MTSLPYPEARDDTLLNLLPRIYAHREEIWAALISHRDDPPSHAHDLGLHLAARFPEVEGLAATLASEPAEVAKIAAEAGLSSEMISEIERIVGLVKSSSMLTEALTRVFPQLAKPDVSSLTGSSRITPEQLGRWLVAPLEAESDHGSHSRFADFDLGREAEERMENTRQVVRRELRADLDPHALIRTGWGVVFPRGKGFLREQLRPLLDMRRKQSGKLYQEITYRPGESGALLWYRHGIAPGVINPRRTPYYLLLVGGPDEIPFGLQCQLSAGYAVGRIAFDDPEDYSRYALNVCRAEHEGARLPRKTVILSAEQEGDKTSELMVRHLVTPLKKRLAGYQPGWGLEVWQRGEATRQRLEGLLGGPETPGLLLVNAHGYSTRPGAAGQRELQGALAYRWAGGKPLYFTARDLPEQAAVHGLIAFLFADHSAGTSRVDSYPTAGSPFDTTLPSEPGVLAERAFVARLPQALLKRGALAVVGHVDRGWARSFYWKARDQELNTVGSFEVSLKNLLRGDRLGHAMRPIYRRYMSLAALLANHLGDLRGGAQPGPALSAEIGRIWTAVQNARNFILLGDPAVYLLGRQQADEETLGARLQPEMRARILAQAAAEGVSPEAWLSEMLKKALREQADK